MILDGLLTFTGTSQGATGGITAGAQTDLPTTGTQQASNIIDLGLSGLPTSANGGGARDIGLSPSHTAVPKLSVIVTTAMGGGTSLELQLLGAPDNGSGGVGSTTVMWQSPVWTEAQMIQGAQLANVDIPRVIWEQVLPRFLILNFISVGTHTSGAVEGQIVLDRDDQIIGTSGNISGYPAGITVAN
jgi:hypothetical protein